MNKKMNKKKAVVAFPAPLYCCTICVTDAELLAMFESP